MTDVIAYAAATARPAAAPATQRPRTLAQAYDGRRNNFDMLRFGLASLVIWSHCFPLSGRAEDWFTRHSGQIDGGSLAVDGFFVLSGFLITQSWLAAPQLGLFATKRALRILPALAFAIAFDALIVGPLATSTSLAGYFASPGPWLHPFGVVLHRWLMIPGVFTSNPSSEWVNAPMWSLRYEMGCYAMVAIVGIVGQRAFPAVTAVVFAISWAASLLLPPSATVPATTARLVACFSAGMLYFVWRDRIPYNWATFLLATAALGATFLGGGLRAAFPIVGGYVLLFIAFTKELGTTGFGRHGDFSYGLYVLAYPIQQLIIHALGTGISVAAFFALSFSVSLALATFSWHWIEAPALAHKPRATHAVTT